MMRLSTGQFGLNALDLFIHGLVSISSCSQVEKSGSSRRPHLVDNFRAPFYRCKDLVPFALDIRSVGVQHRL